jgi:hypothetical protein
MPIGNFVVPFRIAWNAQALAIVSFETSATVRGIAPPLEPATTSNAQVVSATVPKAASTSSTPVDSPRTLRTTQSDAGSASTNPRR